MGPGRVHLRPLLGPFAPPQRGQSWRPGVLRAHLAHQHTQAQAQSTHIHRSSTHRDTSPEHTGIQAQHTQRHKPRSHRADIPAKGTQRYKSRAHRDTSPEHTETPAQSTQRYKPRAHTDTSPEHTQIQAQTKAIGGGKSQGKKLKAESSR